MKNLLILFNYLFQEIAEVTGAEKLFFIIDVILL